MAGHQRHGGQLLSRRADGSAYTRLVLRTTILLVLIGAIGLVLTEWLNSGQNFLTLPWSERWLAALFQSVTARTAGFNTVPISVETITESGTLLVMTLMFIGASPGGTGGGINHGGGRPDGRNALHRAAAMPL